MPFAIIALVIGFKWMHAASGEEELLDILTTNNLSNRTVTLMNRTHWRLCSGAAEGQLPHNRG
jgi:hypothetical protein